MNKLLTIVTISFVLAFSVNAAESPYLLWEDLPTE